MTVELPDPEVRVDPATTGGGTALPRLVGLVAIFGLLLVLGFLALAASGRLFRQERTFVVFFKNPVPLKAGAPVTFRQTALGSVRDVELVLTGRGFDSEIMVVFDIDRSGLRSLGGDRPLSQASDKDFAATLAGAGLRGTVRSSSPVGGQKSLDFDFHPEIEGRLSGLPSPYPELPTGSRRSPIFRSRTSSPSSGRRSRAPRSCSTTATCAGRSRTCAVRSTAPTACWPGRI